MSILNPRYSVKSLLVILHMLLVFFVNAQTVDDSLIINYIQQENDSGKLQAVRVLADEYQENGYYYKALEYYLEARDLEKKVNGNANHNSYRNIGSAFQALKMYDSSYHYYQIAYKSSKTISSVTSGLLSDLQSIAKNQMDLENALKYAEELLHRYLLTRDTVGITRQYNEIGSIYQLRNDYNKATYYFKKAYDLALKDINVPNDFIATILTNLGVSHGYNEEYLEAARFLKSAQDYWPSKDKTNYADSYNYLAANYLAQGQSQLALTSVEKALELAKNIDAGEVLVKSYRILSFIYQIQNDLVQYQSYSSKYQEIKENLEQKETDRVQLQLEMQAELEKRERLIRQRLAEEEKQSMVLEQLSLEQEKRLQELKLAEAALLNKELENKQQKQLLEITQQRALAENRRAEIANQKALNEKQKAEAARLKAEAEARQADAERQQREKEIAELRLAEEQQKSYYFRGLLFLSLLIIGVIVISYFQIRKTLLKLRKTQKQLVQSEKMASIGILSAGISHEINNPLNFINSGVLHLSNEIKERSVKDYKDLEPYVEIIHDGVNRVLNIVKSLGHFSRQSSQMDELCDIHQIVENCLAILQNVTRERIVIEKNFEDEQLIIKGNEGKIHQVFLNVLTNAFQAIKGTGTVRIKTKKSNKKVVINISDDGVGIPSKNLGKIFDPFFTTKNPDEGTGLGLSITYQIMQEHNGKIEIASEEGKGTKFKLIFPVNH